MASINSASLSPPVYRFVVSHFIPGVLALYPTYQISEIVQSLVDVLVRGSTENIGASAGVVGALAILALVMGLIIDGVTFAVVNEPIVAPIRDWLLRHRDGASPLTVQPRPQSLHDLRFIQEVWIYNSAWQQLYVNAALIAVLTVGLSVFSLVSIGGLPTIILIVLVPVLLLASARSWANNDYLLGSYFDPATGLPRSRDADAPDSQIRDDS